MFRFDGGKFVLSGRRGFRELSAFTGLSRSLRRIGLVFFVATSGSCTTGIDDDMPGDAPSRKSEPTTFRGQNRLLVELFSWWTAPGEAESFQSLVDAHKVVDPDARLFNAAAASGVRAKEILRQRLYDGDLPDLYQDNAQDMTVYVLQNPDMLQPLDDLFAALKLYDVVYPEVLKDITVRGKIYGMPVNIHRENTLIYNRKLFAQLGLVVPRTIDDLLVVCDAFKRHGVTAMATSHQGWILRILFNTIVAAKLGAEQYRDFIQGKGLREGEGLRESLRILDDLLTHYANADAGEEGFGWMNAAQAVMNGDAAMYIHGDWAKGYLVQLGANPDTDIGVVAAPGTQELFLYNIDVFSMPRHAPNEAGAKAFLSTIATRTAQATFNRIKGSSPIRTDAVVEELDSLGRETMRDLLGAKVRLLVRSGDGWDDVLGTFAKIRDEEMVYETYVKNAPVVD